MVIKTYTGGVKLLGYGEEEPLINEKDEQTFTPTIYTGGVVKLTPILGTQAKAVGGATLPEPEPKSWLTLGQDPKSMELEKTNFAMKQLWFKELKESKNKVAFLKGEGQSQELEELGKQYEKLAPQMYEKSEKWIGNIAMIAYGIGAVGQLVDAAVTSGFKVKGVKFNAKQLRGVLERANTAYVRETGKFKATLSDNDYAVMKQLNVFLKTTAKSPAAREMLEKVAEQTGGLTFPQQVNIFGGKLYAGVPPDEIVKSIVAVGKLTKDIANQLSLAKPELVSQVIQQLNVASPAIASKLMPELEKLIPTKPEIYTGKAYRAETHIPEHGAEIIGRMNTAQEKLDYDYGTTGNYIFKEAGKKAEELNIDLNKVPITEMIWVAPELEIAKKYGEAEEYKLPEDTIVLAEDNEGGSLVLKNSGNYIGDAGIEPQPKVEGEVVYHGTSKKNAEQIKAKGIKPGDWGFSVSPDRKSAGEFGEILEFTINPDAKIATPDNLKGAKNLFYDREGEISYGTGEVTRIAKEQGFDVVDLRQFEAKVTHPKRITELRIINPDVLIPKPVSPAPPIADEPIPEGGVPPATVDKQNSIFNKAAKKIEDIATKAIQVVDIQAPFNKLDARETGFQIKNYYSNIGLAHQQGLDEIKKLNKFNVKPVTVEESGFKASGQIDYTDVTYLSERPGYFVKLTPEERKIASVAKKSIKDYYKGWESKLKEIGWMEEPFPQSFITRAQNRIGGIRKQLKDVKKPEDKQILLNEIKKLEGQIARIKKQKLQFVSVPAKTIISNAETNPEIFQRIFSILPKWDRATLTVKDLVDAKIITRKEADIRYIIGEYSDRMGKKYALGKIFENAEKEGLIKPQALVPNWLPARIYINGKYVDIPQLRGKRLEPFFSDTVTDFFSRGVVTLGPIMGTIKMMQFFNPLIMPMYDLWQAAAAGVFLNPVKGFEYIYDGIRDVLKHTDKYYLAFENGLFSKPYAIPYDVFERQFKEVMQESKLISTLKKAALPTNWLPMLYHASWSTAWTLDPMVRMMSFNYLLDKGMSPRNAAQLAALYHSDYASVPPNTRRTLNKIFFTPTFKITMGKLLSGMFKGVGKIMAKHPAKLFGKDIKIYQKDKILARGALIALGIMMGIRQYFKSQGYKEEALFWKYSKMVETDEGMKENVITLSHPFNIPFRYLGRIENAWNPANLNVAEKLVATAKWDLHPIWRVAYDIVNNDYYSIYNPFEDSDKVAFDIAKYAFGEFVAITRGLLESAEAGEISAENFRILQKDMGLLKAIILKPFIFNYARDPRKIKAMRDIKKLQEAFSSLQFSDPSKDPAVNAERMRNFIDKVSEIEKSYKEKVVIPKTKRQETFTGGVRLLEPEEEFTGGVKILK